MNAFAQKIKKIIDENIDKIAYAHMENSYTYKTIQESAVKLYEKLKTLKAGAIVLYGHKSVDMIISILACLYSDRTYIPIEPYMPIERIKKIVEQVDVALVINNTENALDEVKSMNLNEIYSADFSNGELSDEVTNDIAYMIFTSGSTGTPKGVPISYDNLNNFVLWINNLIPSKDGTKLSVLNQANLSFDLSVADLYYSLTNGHKLVALEKTDVESYDYIIECIKQNNINVMVATPTFVKMLLLDKSFCMENYISLQTIYLCGELLETALAKKIIERFPDIHLINAYGPTEATSAVSGIRIEKEMLNEKYLPVGRVSEATTEIQIEENEIVLIGKSVFSGYLNIESDKCYTNSKGENIFKTGDIGKIENDFLYCYGRKDSQIKYKGYRIELTDIENNLKLINGIFDAAVVAEYKHETEIVKAIKAYVVLENKLLEEKDVKRVLSEMLPQYMMPSTITILDKFPTNENGKIDRKKLIEDDRHIQVIRRGL